MKQSTRVERRPVYRPLFEDFDLESYYADNGDRYYRTPEGDFPSVTTLLGRYSDADKSGLERWKKSVGEERANTIMKSAGVRGTKLHSMIESYLRGKENPTEGHMPLNVEMFQTLKPVLEQIVVTYGLELALYSPSLRMAGRCDCVAHMAGKNVLIDFKNARSRKEREWVKDYFLQATSYSIMLMELFNFRVDLFIILIANTEGQKQVFYGDPRNYVHDPFFWKVYSREED